MTWETVIGLEVHVQLTTRSKLFCACRATFGAAPNTHVCPVCLGLPGALPVLNGRAVRLAIRAALALGFGPDAITPVSVFARKHYFYPDLPKGYQITQYDRPLAREGRFRFSSPVRGSVELGLTRLHLEEDAGKSLYDRVPGRTAVDFNRCGIPLVEIVSAPDLRSPAEARACLATLRQVLEYAEVSDGNMEEGSLRVDANLSVRRPGARLGVRQEIKNLNSLSMLERALERLQDRQRAVLDRGDTVAPTTFSAATGELRAMRAKEERADYRYLPDPDLPPLDLARQGCSVAAERAALPELPAARRARFTRELGLAEPAAGVLTATRRLADYYEAVVAAGADPQEAATWVTGPVLADANAHDGALRVPPARVAALIRLVGEGTVSRQAGGRILPALAAHVDPRAVAERMGLVQVRDVARLRDWVDTVLGEHPEEVARFRAGEEKLLEFFLGQVMRRSGGRADPGVARRLLARRLRA